MFSKHLRRLREVSACRKQTRQWIPLTLAYSRLRRLSFPYPLRLRSGETLTLCELMDVIIFWLVFARRHYPVEASDRSILDIGANVGIFTLYAARVAPSARIVAVEPFPGTFDRLVRHVQVNGLEQRVRCLNCAVTGAAGSQFMESAPGIPSQYRPVISPLTSALNVGHKGLETPSGDKVAVNCVTLEGLLDATGFAQADLVKMNIHGNEYEVLLSASPGTLRKCRRIALQYHEVPASLKLGKQQLVSHLARAGLKLSLDVDTGRGAGLAVFAA